MTAKQHEPVAIDIQLHQKSRVLEIKFDDGAHFKLPCEYLRVFSPSAEVKASKNQGQWVSGKEKVGIENIKPVGSYAIQLYFDDGHDTGIYSWKTLYELGVRQEANWKEYRQQLASKGLPSERLESDEPIQLRILYFVSLPKEVGCESEEVRAPSTVRNVQDLIDWLRKRGQRWDEALGRNALKITINKKFAEPDTALAQGDEVAIVPAPPQ